MRDFTPKPVQSQRAPKAVGPYSQAVQAGDLLFVSGQLPLDPADSSLVGQDIQAQVKQVLENLKNLLSDAGMSLANVVKTTMFLKNMADFAAANEVYGRYFKAPYPARSTVEVARLPKDVLVEIEAIALVPR